MSKVIIIDYIWKRKESLDDDDNWIQHRKGKRETLIYVKGSILSFIIAASIGLSMSPRTHTHTHTHTGIFRFGSLISTVCVCVYVQSVIYSKVITWDLAISLTRWSLKLKKKFKHLLIGWLSTLFIIIFYIWVIKASFVVVVVVVV